MPLSNWRKKEEQKPELDINEIVQQTSQAVIQSILPQLQQNVTQQLQPVLLAVQALTSGRQPVEEEGSEEQPRQNNQLTPDTIRQLIRQEFETNVPNVTKNYTPKGRLAAQRLFFRELTPKERELYDKHQDEIETVIDGISEENQSNSQSWGRAFDFVMSQHMDEYAPVYLEQMKPEELPPHLQQPVGGGQQSNAEPEVQLSEDEQTMQQIFDRTYRGGFTPEQFKGFSELPFSDVNTMVAQARAKGLIKDGKANQGNNAQEGQHVSTDKAAAGV